MSWLHLYWYYFKYYSVITLYYHFSGNFVDLVNKKFYDGMKLQKVEQLTVQTGKPAGGDGYVDPKTKQVTKKMECCYIREGNSFLISVLTDWISQCPLSLPSLYFCPPLILIRITAQHYLGAHYPSRALLQARQRAHIRDNKRRWQQSDWDHGAALPR